jgi:hypothetical protein
MENGTICPSNRRVELYLKSLEVITQKSPVKDSCHTTWINQTNSSYFALNSRETGIRDLVVKVTNIDSIPLDIYDLAYRTDRLKALSKGILTSPQIYVDGHKIEKIPDSEQELSNILAKVLR